MLSFLELIQLGYKIGALSLTLNFYQNMFEPKMFMEIGIFLLATPLSTGKLMFDFFTIVLV